MRRLLFVIAAAAIMTLTANAAVYNLANDWSDTSNPNGVWSLYKNAYELFTVNQADFYNNGAYQKAWADEVCFYNAHVPVWLKSQDNGEIHIHGAEYDRTWSDITFVRWTSPESGMVTIDGSVWTVGQNYRYMNWELRYEGTAITGGSLYSDGNQGASNPVLFSQDSGGSDVLTFSIEAGQTIDLVFISASESGNLGEMLGVDLTLCELSADLTGNCFVDMEDFALFASGWLRDDCTMPDWCGRADFDTSGDVGMEDLMELATQWLTGVRP